MKVPFRKFPICLRSEMKIGVLGATGFVGQNLITKIKSNGWYVKTYSRTDLDLSSLDSFAKIDFDFDFLINCAGYIGADFEKNYRVNLISVLHLCEELNRRTIKPHLIHFSTGGVYGYSSEMSSHATVPRPNSTYALCKYLADEAILKSYSGKSSIFRLYFPFGPGQNLDRFVPRMASNILSGTPISLSSFGDFPLLNPIYIDDLCEQVCEHLKVGGGGLVLLGGKDVISVRELAIMIGDILGISPVFLVSEGVKANMYCQGVEGTDLSVALRKTIDSIMRDV